MTTKFQNIFVSPEFGANQTSQPECVQNLYHFSYFIFYFHESGRLENCAAPEEKPVSPHFAKQFSPHPHTVSVISPTEILQIEPGNFTASEKRCKSVGMIREIPSALLWPVNRQSKWRQQSSCTRMSVLCENHFKVIVRNSIFVVVLDCLHSHFNSFQEVLWKKQSIFSAYVLFINKAARITTILIHRKSSFHALFSSFIHRLLITT